jgi:hypothetical protein
MHDVAGHLTSLHNQLNHYVYLTVNLDELRRNVEQIKVERIKLNRRVLFFFSLDIVLRSWKRKINGGESY